MIKAAIIKTIDKIKESRVPEYLKKNRLYLPDNLLKDVEISIKENYHCGWRNKANYTPDQYNQDLLDHLIGRLSFDRTNYIPWLNKTIKLKGSRVLEIGCGTGSSTIALAEQGAIVTGIDFDQGALAVAKDRCKAYNVSANLILGNACEVYEDLKNEKFDLIIFFACIEHMTYYERIDSLRKYYNLLPQGAYISIVETPNRLWYFDTHTSRLPLFNWLPDRLAYDYSKHSKRNNFKELYTHFSEDQFLHFLRRGRGFSFHELEIAFDIPAEKLQVVDYMSQVFYTDYRSYLFHKLLVSFNPKICKGFFNSNIDVILKK